MEDARLRAGLEWTFELKRENERLRAQLRERDVVLRERNAEIARLETRLVAQRSSVASRLGVRGAVDGEGGSRPRARRSRCGGAGGLLGLVDSGVAGEIAGFLRTADALRVARCGGREFLEVFSAALADFDIGLPEMRPSLGSDRARMDAALVAVLGRSPRIATLVLSHRTHVSVETLRSLGCCSARLERLGLRNCFRLTVPQIFGVVSRCSALADLDVSTHHLAPQDVETLVAVVPTLRTLCVSYAALKSHHADRVPAIPESLARLELFDRDWRASRGAGRKEGRNCHRSFTPSHVRSAQERALTRREMIARQHG